MTDKSRKIRTPDEANDAANLILARLEKAKSRDQRAAIMTECETEMAMIHLIVPARIYHIQNLNDYLGPELVRRAR
jgi:hypothetical protein